MASLIQNNCLLQHAGKTRARKNTKFASKIKKKRTTFKRWFYHWDETSPNFLPDDDNSRSTGRSLWWKCPPRDARRVQDAEVAFFRWPKLPLTDGVDTRTDFGNLSSVPKKLFPMRLIVGEKRTNQLIFGSPKPKRTNTVRYRKDIDDCNKDQLDRIKIYSRTHLGLT